MSSSNKHEEIKEFCKKYECSIIDTNKRCARYHRDPSFFIDPTRADIMNTTSLYKTEKLLTIEIPESRLANLVEMEGKFYNYSTNIGHQYTFEMLIDKERKESYIRQTNPAVKKAYEEYSLLLHLAQ